MEHAPERGLDLTVGDTPEAPRGTTDASRGAGDAMPDTVGKDGSPRPWLGIHFECCGAYARIYRNAARSHYEGACPRCRRMLRVPIGPDGTAQRIFRAS